MKCPGCLRGREKRDVLAAALERLLNAQTGVNMGDLAGALTQARAALSSAGGMLR